MLIYYCRDDDICNLEGQSLVNRMYVRHQRDGKKGFPIPYNAKLLPKHLETHFNDPIQIPATSILTPNILLLLLLNNPLQSPPPTSPLPPSLQVPLPKQIAIHSSIIIKRNRTHPRSMTMSLAAKLWTFQWFPQPLLVVLGAPERMSPRAFQQRARTESVEPVVLVMGMLDAVSVFTWDG